MNSLKFQTNMHIGKNIINPKNILVIRLGAMGDIIHVIPAVKNVREALPECNIAWLVEDKIKDLVETVPGVDEVIVFPRKRWQAWLKRPGRYFQIISEMIVFFRQLRAKKYDVVLDFHGNFKSGILGYLSASKIRAGFSRGYCKEFNYLFTNVRIAPQQKAMHRIEKYLSLVRGLGIKAHYQKPVFSLSEQDRSYINDFILQNQLDQKPMAILHPGTSLFGKYKRWSPEKYAQLSDKLIEEFGYAVVFTWSGKEYDIAEDIRSRMRFPATISCKTASVKQLIALLQRASLYIGGDTGPTHLASCLGIPTIAIFGPKDPVIYAPYDDNSLVVRKDIDCSPCEKRRCDHVTCIHSITPDDVYAKVCELRKKRSLTF
ncbi:MAG: glycosyltransferase family 9 protein [Planctomycetes bacterium]|nr:glycosyltransferase family 9 protein [Planctomycetota bacterium]